LSEQHEQNPETTSPGTTIPVALVGTVVGLSLLGDSMLYAVLPTRAEQLCLTAAQISLLLSINRFVRLLTNPLAATVYRRFGYRPSLACAVLLATATTASYGLFRSFTVLLAARACWGLCWSVFRLGGYLAVLDASGRGREGRLMGVFVSVSRVGMLSGLILGGILADAIGFRATLLLFAALTAAGFVFVALGPAVETRTASHGGISPWRELVSTHCLAIKAGGLCGGMVVPGIIGATTGYVLLNRFGSEIGLAGATLGVATLSAIVLASRHLFNLALGPSIGKAADRFGPLRATTVAMLLCVVGSACLALEPGLHWTLLAFLVVLFGGAVIGITLPVALGRAASAERKPDALAAYATWWDAGSATGPLVGYRIAAALSLGAIYWTAAALMLIPVTVFLFPRPAGHRPR